MRLEFRAPGVALPLGTLLQRALPAAEPAALVGSGAVDVSGLRRIRTETSVPPGARIGIAWEGPDPQARLAERSGDSVLVLVPSVPWQRGELEHTRKLPALGFERRESRAGLSELLIRGSALHARQVLERLARFGYAVVGDLRRGGLLAEGGLRLAFGSEPPNRSWWPEEPLLLGLQRGSAAAGAPPGSAAAGSPPAFAVSDATRRALERGHPWVLRDDETDDAARFAAGALVRIESKRQGEAAVLARVEDGGRVAARVWERSDTRASAHGTGSVEQRVAAALARRRALLDPRIGAAPTNALRLVHGEADGLPGLSIDRLGPVLRVVQTGRAADLLLQRAVACVCHSLERELGPDPPVVEVVHLRDRPPGRLCCVRVSQGQGARLEKTGSDEPSGRLKVEERGISFWVDPGLAQPEKPSPGVGLYLDQRQNRERLAAHARRGGRWLNLFAHTGAFSLALLAAGAEQVTSVDLSARVLRWLEANLELNPSIERSQHQSVRADGRHYLEARRGAADRFDGIVIDPPTAAAGGRGYWKLERDLPPLVEMALRRLAPGGVLFVSRNDRRRRESALDLLRASASRAGVVLSDLEAAPPGPDFPRLRGFPEGDSFDAAIARLS